MCHEVHIVNSAPNPKTKKVWSLDQARTKRAQAERFARQVLDDPDFAAEIAEMSPEYAESRGTEVNLNLGGGSMHRKAARENSTGRENPTVRALETASRALEAQNELQKSVRQLEGEVEDRDKKLDLIADVIEDHELSPKELRNEIDQILGPPEEESKDEDEDEVGEQWRGEAKR